MNILFLSLGRYWSINEREGYTDLLREFVRHGDNVFIVSPTERREGKETQLIQEENSVILKVKTGNIQKTNIIEKGISTLLIETQFLKAIKKYFANIKFDLVLYPTPPITFVSVIEYIKKRDNARTYLLLKDIFPQNAVDIGMMSTTGIGGVLYNYFKNKERRLYNVSDTVGCMSPKNVKYLLDHNPEISKNKVEVCPNVIEVVDKSIDAETKKDIRMKYRIPVDKTIFVYGGNLGKPQGIPFLIKCVGQCKELARAFFLIVGDGTEYGILENYIQNESPENMLLMKRLPKEDYDTVISACDIGMIFLDHRFTIPNFPSRLLGYMQAKLPVLACTDPNTDIGKVIVDGGFGWWCESDDARKFKACVNQVLGKETKMIGELGFQYLQNNYSVSNAYETIMKCSDT